MTKVLKIKDIYNRIYEVKIDEFIDHINKYIRLEIQFMKKTDFISRLMILLEIQ